MSFEQISSLEKKFLDDLQHCYNQLANESKKKFPSIKEVCLSVFPYKYCLILNLFRPVKPELYGLEMHHHQTQSCQLVFRNRWSMKVHKLWNLFLWPVILSHKNLCK